MSENASKAEREAAATERKKRLDALEQELVGYERYGREDRAAAVKAEIARVKKTAPSGRRSAPESTASDTTAD